MELPKRIKRENIPPMKAGRIITVHSIEQEWDKDGKIKKDKTIESNYTLVDGTILKSIHVDNHLKSSDSRWKPFEQTSLSPKDVGDILFEVLKHDTIEGKNKDGTYNYFTYASYVDEDPYKSNPYDSPIYVAKKMGMRGYNTKKNKSTTKTSTLPKLNVRKMF